MNCGACFPQAKVRAKKVCTKSCPSALPCLMAICRKAAWPAARCMRSYPRRKARYRRHSASSWRSLPTFFPSPNKHALGRAPARPGWGEGQDCLRRAGLWAAQAWPSFRARPQRSRPRSGAPDPGRDGAPQRNTVGGCRGVAFGSAASGRRDDRQARSEDQPKTASRRQRCGPAAVAVTAGANAGSKRCGNALARRHGGSRTRPLRHARAPTMASAT